MKSIITQDDDRARGTCLGPESLDPCTFRLHADYILRHGWPHGPLSTLTPDRRMQTERKAHGVLPE